MKPRLPDFAIISPGRTGTAWLVKAMARSPQVFMLAGEQHYLHANDLLEAIRSTYSPASRIKGKSWDRLRSVPRPLFGDKSPSHFRAPLRRIRELHALRPDLRLIVGVREPVSRALSHLVHIGVDLAKPVDEQVLAKVIKHGRYRENLARWARIFPSAQIMLYDFSDLTTGGARKVLEGALHHIGADPVDFTSDWIAEVSQPGQHTPGRPIGDVHPDLLPRLEEACADDVWSIDRLRAELATAAPDPGR